MIRLGDYLWRPRRVFNSVGDWALAANQRTALKALPAPPPGRAAAPAENSNRWQLAELPEGKVVGDLRMIATAQNEVLGQLQALHGIADPAAHWVTHQLRFRQPKRLRGTALVLAPAGANYYHWLFDGLPRLRLLELADVTLDRVDFFLLNEAEQSFDRDALQWLGIPPHKIFRCSKRQIITADRLLVPPMPTPLQGQVAPWVGEFLRAAFLPKSPTTGQGARLYLSRRQAPKRRLANEVEVEDFFRARGFQSIQLETLSFREQVETFSNAGFVAGPHGAGFTNLVFAPAQTRVLELFHPQHQVSLYEQIATLAGMNYQRIVGEAPNETESELSERLGPYSVSIQTLDNYLTG